MTNMKYIIVFFVSLVVITGLIVSSAIAADASKPDQNHLEIGRDNPFAEITRPKKPSAGYKTVSASSYDQSQELTIRTVTLKNLNAASLKKVLDSLSSEYGSISTDENTNSVIICDTKERLSRILEQIRKAEETVSPYQIIPVPKYKPELFVETVTLKFLSTKSLKDVIDGMSSEYGSISMDSKTNSLVICDTKENLERILYEIERADRRPPQIMVEVVIADVQLDDDTEIGINWDILSDKNYDIGYRQNFTTSRLRSTVEDADTIGDATAFVTRGLGGDFSVISGTIRNVVHLLQQKRNTEILASPRVMVVSGQTAFIEAVEELPYTEASSSSEGGLLETTEFKDVGVKLNVTATLLENNGIYLTVESEQNVASGQSNTEIPIIDTRNVKTSLLLKDGEVVVLGGLRRQEKTQEIDQIPILGDIPIVGDLFKSTTTMTKNAELIIFISPHIYKEKDIPEEAMRKFKEITKKPILKFPEKEKFTVEEIFSSPDSED